MRSDARSDVRSNVRSEGSDVRSDVGSNVRSEWSDVRSDVGSDCQDIANCLLTTQPPLTITHQLLQSGLTIESL